MISTLYLHEHDILDSFMEETYHIMNDVYDAQNRLIAAENYIDEQVFMGESADDYRVLLEETKKNVFTTIGEKMIELFKKIIDSLKEFGTKIGEHLKGMKKHAGDEALKEQMKNDPELAKKFIEAVMSGNIKVHDVKDMDDLLKTAQQLTKDLSSGKIDEDQYMKKVDEKLDKYASRAKNITAILGVVIGTTGILAAIDKLGANGKAVQAKTAKDRLEWEAMREDAMRDANKELGGNSNRLAVMLKGHQKIAAAMQTDLSGWRSVIAKGEGWLGSQVGKVKLGYNRKDDNRAKDRLSKLQRDEEDKLRRQEDIKNSVSDRYRREQEQRQARQRREERNEQRQYDIRSHNRNARTAEDIAYRQQKGRNRANAEDHPNDQNP